MTFGGCASEINVSRIEGGEHEKVLSMQAQYGCGKSSASQLPWLAMYILNASASSLDISLSIQQRGDVHRIFASALNFALSHGILFLGSVIHHVPTAAPHSWLLLYMCGVLLFYSANSCLGVYGDIMHGL